MEERRLCLTEIILKKLRGLLGFMQSSCQAFPVLLCLSALNLSVSFPRHLVQRVICAIIYEL